MNGMTIQAIKELHCPLRNPHIDQGKCNVRHLSRTRYPELKHHLCTKCPPGKHERVRNIISQL